MSADRIFAVAVVTAGELLSAEILPLVPENDWYFAACVAFNAAVFLFLRQGDQSQVIVDAEILTVFQMVIQFVGWILYLLYLPATTYNWSIHAIVILTYARILLIDKNNGNHQDYRGWTGIHRFTGLGHISGHGDQKC